MSSYPSSNDSEFDLLKKIAANSADIAGGGGSGGSIGAVDSVNAQTGVVVLTTADVADTLNKRYVTDAQRTAIGGVSGTASGTNTGDQDLSGLMVKSANLSDVANATTSRTNLGLGTLSTQSGTFSGTSSGTNTGDQTNITGNSATVTTNANLTGPVTSVGNATTITDAAVTLAKMANLAQDAFIVRTTASTGVPQTATCTAAGRALIDDADATAQRTTLGLGTLATQSGTFSGTSSGTNTGDQTITLTGDVTGAGTGSFAATLANTAVTPGSYTNTSLTVDSKGRITSASTGAAGGTGTKTLERWTAQDNQPPATNYATFSTRNSIAVLEFDASTAEDAVFVSIIPEASDFTTGISVFIHWMAASATTGNVIWTSAFERSNTDLDADSFATGVDSAAAAANGTTGIVTKTQIDHSGSQMDGAVAGDLFRLKITRKAADGSDTMTGDAQIIAIEVRQR